MRLWNDVLLESNSLLPANLTNAIHTELVVCQRGCRPFILVPFAQANDSNVRKFVRFEESGEEVERNVIEKVKACKRRREIVQ